MKKNYILTLLMMLCLTVTSFGQEMMLNGGLENWISNTRPTDWTTYQNITQESSEKHGGSFSAKQTKDATGGYKKLIQNIPNTTVGESYTVSFWYKIAPDAGSVVKMWSNFRDASGAFLDGTTADITLPVNDNAWTKYEETVIAPATSVKFWFEVRTYSNTTVYFDDFSFVRNPFTWTGAANNNYNDAANWSTNTVPSENYDIIIPSSATINMPATLTVNSMSIAAGASIISTGTITGSISYTRNIPTDNWYLISSPVADQDKDAFVSASSLAISGINVGFADYENSTGDWSYYQSGASGTGNFGLGEGHAVKLNTAGDVVFTGTFNDAESIAVSSTPGYNLIGNPYLTSVSVKEMLEEANNANLLLEQTVWLWDQALGTYDLKNIADDMEIAPGQAFFVSAAQTGSFSINESMQSHSSDTFQKITTRPELALTLSNGAASRTASVFYIDGATTGFDNGYDSSIFGGLGNEFSIFTHAVANGSGRNLGTQSLPDNNFENMIVPVGVIAESGSALEFSARLENLPEGIKVFLEDKEENTFTRLDELNASHKITTTSIINSVGRFYLHTAKSVLSISDATLDNVSILKVHNSLRISGLQQGKASVKLFNVLGKQVLNSAFEFNGMKDISLPRVAKGIYIVQLETAEGTLNKKIILE
ncbi:hypothetical protein BTO04_05145 [Polaribacter sp. SA4-10]|uniref:T9SS type A sorting domain-containing protein n=1 Tax=Polaribacter sp. SA4-10 TaxID=754397 RepID=UPI000B3D4E62|nr:T9SS type A sorting domain-containing protein [Polaribacter sp. SA4-10]ARV06125.1 hypothetical protein BTO04_05145 [Polaribacter sp. SA4-10]